jgi:hypothetical protein
MHRASRSAGHASHQCRGHRPRAFPGRRGCSRLTQVLAAPSRRGWPGSGPLQGPREGPGPRRQRTRHQTSAASPSAGSAAAGGARWRWRREPLPRSGSPLPGARSGQANSHHRRSLGVRIAEVKLDDRILGQDRQRNPAAAFGHFQARITWYRRASPRKRFREIAPAAAPAPRWRMLRHGHRIGAALTRRKRNSRTIHFRYPAPGQGCRGRKSPAARQSGCGQWRHQTVPVV